MVGLQFLPYSFIIEFELVFPRTIYEIAYPRLTLVRASTNGVETQKLWYINTMILICLVLWNYLAPQRRFHCHMSVAFTVAVPLDAVRRYHNEAAVQ